jgi:hypothetical protein
MYSYVLISLCHSYIHYYLLDHFHIMIHCRFNNQQVEHNPTSFYYIPAISPSDLYYIPLFVGYIPLHPNICSLNSYHNPYSIISPLYHMHWFISHLSPYYIPHISLCILPSYPYYIQPYSTIPPFCLVKSLICVG